MKRIVRRGGSSKHPQKDEDISIHTGKPKCATRTPRWPETHNAVFGDLLMEQYVGGNITNNTLRKECWKDVVAALNRRLNSDYSEAAVITRFKNMKSDFRCLFQLTNRSGWGWDEDQHLPIAPDEIWDEILRENPKLGRYRKNPFHQYEIFSQICGENYATGKGVRTTSKHFHREEIEEVQSHEEMGDELLTAHDLHFVDAVVDESIRIEDDVQETVTPMSRSKRTNNKESNRSGRSIRKKMDTEAFNTLLIHNIETGEAVNNSLASTFPYSMSDCLDKLATIEGLSTEALLAVNDALTQNNDNKATIMKWDGDILRAWITHVVKHHPLYKDCPIWL